MKFTVLVVDDELDKPAPYSKEKKRREYYASLESCFELLYLQDLSRINTLVSERVIDAVLIDFVLDKGRDARTVLQVLGNRLPVCLISSHWGTVFEDLRVTLDEYDVAQLFTWEDLETAERRDLVALWLDAAIRKSKDLSLTRLKRDEDIRILQLSDLQFGSVLPDAFDAETELMAQAIRRHWGAGGPHFIALTGDNTEHALPEEYSQAAIWTKQLAEKLDADWSHRRFLLIPGNHDLCWALGLSSRIDIKEKRLRTDSVLEPQLRAFSLAPFRHYAEDMQGEFAWGGNSQWWTCGRYRQAGVIFFGYNTSESIDDWIQPTRNVVDKTVAQMFTEVRRHKEDAPKALVIGLMHHPLISDQPLEGIANPNTFLKNLSDRVETVVTLSGHVHGEGYSLQERDAISLLEIVASTATKKERPEDTLRGFNLITLRRQGGRIRRLEVSFCRFERSRVLIPLAQAFDRDENGRFVRDLAT